MKKMCPDLQAGSPSVTLFSNFTYFGTRAWSKPRFYCSFFHCGKIILEVMHEISPSVNYTSSLFYIYSFSLYISRLFCLVHFTYVVIQILQEAKCIMYICILLLFNMDKLSAMASTISNSLSFNVCTTVIIPLELQTLEDVWSQQRLNSLRISTKTCLTHSVPRPWAYEAAS